MNFSCLQFESKHVLTHGYLVQSRCCMHQAPDLYAYYRQNSVKLAGSIDYFTETNYQGLVYKGKPCQACGATTSQVLCKACSKAKERMKG